MGYFLKREKIDYMTAAYKFREMFPELKNIPAEQVYDKIRFSDIEMYKKDKKKTNILMRSTMPLALVVIVLLVVFSPITFIFRGTWAHGSMRLENWFRALRLIH